MKVQFKFFVPIFCGFLLCSISSFPLAATVSQDASYSLLFSLTTESATIKPDSGNGHQLIVPSNTQVLVFSDRPARKAYVQTVSSLVNDWKNLGFDVSPPNAAIVLNRGDKNAQAVVEIVAAINETKSKSVFGLKHLPQMTALGVSGGDSFLGINPRSTLRNQKVSIFIDDGQVNNSCNGDQNGNCVAPCSQPGSDCPPNTPIGYCSFKSCTYEHQNCTPILPDCKPRWINVCSNQVSACPAAPPIIIGQVSPANGSPAGGTLLSIFFLENGFDPNSVSNIMIGGQACTNMIFSVNSNSATCLTPAASGFNPVSAFAAQPAVIQVSNSVGSKTLAIPGASFTYASYTPMPSIQSISPSSGPASGGSTIKILGTHLSSARTVTVGGNICGNLSIIDDASLTCTTPAITGYAPSSDPSANTGPAMVQVQTQYGTTSGNISYGYTTICQQGLYGMPPICQ